MANTMFFAMADTEWLCFSTPRCTAHASKTSLASLGRGSNVIRMGHCCIAGGGPAGIMLGYLLARAGVDVIVLEKHDDFLRDFRGDTIHPSTLAVLQDLGLFEAFMRLPHQEVQDLTGDVFGQQVTIADFRHLSTPGRCLVLIPQWDFLDFIASQARKLPRF